MDNEAYKILRVIAWAIALIVVAVVIGEAIQR